MVQQEIDAVKPAHLTRCTAEHRIAPGQTHRSTPAPFEVGGLFLGNRRDELRKSSWCPLGLLLWLFSIQDWAPGIVLGIAIEPFLNWCWHAQPPEFLTVAVTVEVGNISRVID